MFQRHNALDLMEEPQPLTRPNPWVYHAAHLICILIYAYCGKRDNECRKDDKNIVNTKFCPKKLLDMQSLGQRLNTFIQKRTLCQK